MQGMQGMGQSKTSGGPSMASSNATPDSYLTSRTQQSGVDPDINPDEIPAGGPSVFPLLDPKGPDAGNPVGTTAGTGGGVPYKGLK
jgi:hypothetical protein